jgi:hypothetical protein
VTCRIEDDEKAGITAIAAITAEGEKLPLTVLGKAKTPRCLAGLELPDSVNGDSTRSGWTNTDVMCRYFAYLRTRLFADQEPLIVIHDTYPAHRAEWVRCIARLWNITLVFIPPGCTDRLQPLDRKVFGVLKASAREIWRKHYHETKGAKTSRPEIIRNLVEAWDRISHEVMESAWDIYTRGNDDGPEDNGDEEFQLRQSLQDLQDLN